MQSGGAGEAEKRPDDDVIAHPFLFAVHVYDSIIVWCAKLIKFASATSEFARVEQTCGDKGGSFCWLSARPNLPGALIRHTENYAGLESSIGCAPIGHGSRWGKLERILFV